MSFSFSMAKLFERQRFDTSPEEALSNCTNAANICSWSILSQFATAGDVAQSIIESALVNFANPVFALIVFKKTEEYLIAEDEQLATCFRKLVVGGTVDAFIGYWQRDRVEAGGSGAVTAMIGYLIGSGYITYEEFKLFVFVILDVFNATVHLQSLYVLFQRALLSPDFVKEPVFLLRTLSDLRVRCQERFGFITDEETRLSAILYGALFNKSLGLKTGPAATFIVTTPIPTDSRLPTIKKQNQPKVLLQPFTPSGPSPLPPRHKRAKLDQRWNPKTGKRNCCQFFPGHSSPEADELPPPSYCI